MNLKSNVYSNIIKYYDNLLFLDIVDIFFVVFSWIGVLITK